MPPLPETPESVSVPSSASVSDDHAEHRPQKAPRELKPWQAWFTTLCLPLFTTMFLCALLGLFVLTDEKQTTWISQTWFGTQWRRLIDFNAFFSAACLNGGLLGTIISYVRLKEHQTAKQYREFKTKFKVYKPSDSTQAWGRKQTKARRTEKKHR